MAAERNVPDLEPLPRARHSGKRLAGASIDQGSLRHQRYFDVVVVEYEIRIVAHVQRGAVIGHRLIGGGSVRALSGDLPAEITHGPARAAERLATAGLQVEAVALAVELLRDRTIDRPHVVRLQVDCVASIRSCLPVEARVIEHWIADGDVRSTERVPLCVESCSDNFSRHWSGAAAAVRTTGAGAVDPRRVGTAA